MLLHRRLLEQNVDRATGRRALLEKEVRVTTSKVPLALVRKRPREGVPRGVVLLVHGFGQNRYAWHLPSRSFANHLAARGYDVWNLDLRGHGRSRAFSRARPGVVHDYVEEDLPAAFEEIAGATGGRPAVIVGHSLGGLVAYAAAPALGARVAGLVSIGSPFHFARGSRPLGALAFVAAALTTARVPRLNPELPLRPVGLTLRSLRGLAESRVSPLPLRGWSGGHIEPHVLAEHFDLAFDRAGFDELRSMFDWARERRFGGRARAWAESFAALDRPLLVVAGGADDLAPPAAVEPAVRASRARDRTYHLVERAGHIDLLVGTRAPETTWATVDAWLDARHLG